MCGIFLYLIKNGKITNEKSIECFNYFMKFKNRGPDNTIYQIYDKFIIGFHRLSINGVDNVESNQPFTKKIGDKIYYCICNGEIYNYKKLAEKYEISLTTKSDCEVILPMLLKSDNISSTISEIDGEYAFIILCHDVLLDTYSITVARDHCGIRPLFISYNDNSIILSSELKGIPKSHYNDYVDQFPPKNFLHIDNFNTNVNNINALYTKYYNDYITSLPINSINNEDYIKNVHENIYNLLYASVENRLMADRDIGCLLSGGLDSSIVCSIVADIYKKRKYNAKLKTFCIGISKDATDMIYAQQVADYIGSDHTSIVVDINDFLNVIPEIVNITETFDITTIRATVGQYMISKIISQQTNIKVLLIGDGSDELFGGYLYFLNNTDPVNQKNECYRLIDNIHKYDVLRSDRGISANGLEARVPFLSIELVKYVRSLDPSIIMNKNNVEKSLLRDVFRNRNLLPLSIINRQKEAFSDGVSNTDMSWYNVIQNYVNVLINDDHINKYDKYKHCKPYTKESLYYRELFCNYYDDKVSNVIPYFWLPKWSNNITDPSARLLNNYNNK